MLDNTLIQLFLPIISTGLSNLGLTNIPIKQANQPTQQGANTEPTIYFYKLYDIRYGWLGRHDTALSPSTMIHTETQFYKTAFQFSALYRQNPNMLTYIASDLLNYVAAILQSDQCISTLAANNVGVLRITDVRNPYFFDDRDEHEAIPSFDVVFTHSQILTNTIDAIETVTSVIDNI